MSEMDELQAFLDRVVGVLERLDIGYMIVGGYAATYYGEPRLTLDVDIVVNMHWEHIQALVTAFPSPDYYMSEESVRDSLTRCYPFNIIETATAAKVDLVPLPSDVFTRVAFQRRQRLAYDAEGHTATFILPEDLVVAKLRAYQATQSDRHLRDAQGVLVMQWEDLDMELIRRAARAADVSGAYEMMLELARREAANMLDTDTMG
jgi:hypothetical protein